jgi:predicted transposase YbfD/YdcC
VLEGILVGIIDASLLRKAMQSCSGVDTRYFIASACLTPERAAEAIRSHWGVESLHWVLDVVFKEDHSRLRRGYGAQNMALVRRLAFNMVRAGKGRHSIKTARKTAAWSTDALKVILNPPR